MLLTLLKWLVGSHSSAVDIAVRVEVVSALEVRHNILSLIGSQKNTMRTWLGFKADLTFPQDTDRVDNDCFPTHT